MIREAAVQGKFYPGGKERLLETVKNCIEAGTAGHLAARAVMAPHAGYIFSGRTAGLTYSGIKVPDRVVVIGPNHYGRGPEISIMPEGVWNLPGMTAEIDEELAGAILEKSAIAKADSTAHESEHSIEVQLPFILYKNPRAKFVPVCISTYDVDKIEDIGEAVGHAIEKTDFSTLIVASSDMSHYVSVETAKKLDMMAVKKILTLDWRGLLETVHRENISMCGAAAAAAMLKASLILQARKGRLADYSTSGDILEDAEEVVGYAGVVIS